MPSLQLPADRTAPARARRFVAETMEQWKCEGAIGDVALLVSELVTNAILHARSATRLTIDRDGATLRVSVWDASPTRPRLRRYTPDAVTGRGLLLVDRIASRWGVDERDGGKSVWFEVVPSEAAANGDRSRA